MINVVSEKIKQEQDPNLLHEEIERLSEKILELENYARSPKSFDRDFLMMRGSMSQRAAYAELAQRIKKPLLDRRAELGRIYCETFADQIAPELQALDLHATDAFASFNLAHLPKVAAAVTEAQRILEETGGIEAKRPGKDSLEYVISAGKVGYGQDSAAYALATSPDLIVPITRYFGALPMLTGYSITLGRNDAYHRKSSQRLHFDPEDRVQIKVFVYITDVDEESGPFMTAGVAASEPLFNKPNLILDRMDDSVVPEGTIHKAVGPSGTVNFCDTCRTLHAGARQGSRPRIVLSIEYNLPTYLWAPLYEGDGVHRDRMGGVTVEPKDEIESALLGRSLVFDKFPSWHNPASSD